MGSFIFQIFCKVTEFIYCYVVNKLWQSGTSLQSHQARKKHELKSSVPIPIEIGGEADPISNYWSTH